MSNIKALLGKRIRELRKERHLTQEKLAELVGIDTRNLIKIENSQTFPKPQTIDKFVEIFDVAPDEIFKFDHLEDSVVLINKIINKLESDEKLLKLIYKMLF